MTTPKIDRKVRLCGDPKLQQGGGMPLGDATQAMLTYLLDHEHATLNKLTQVTHDTFPGKTARLTTIYHKEAGMQGDPYTLYTQDLLDQLTDRNLVKLNGAGYMLGSAFKVGVSLQLFNNLGAGTVFPREQRAVLERAAQTSLEVKALTNELRPDGRGIRLLRQDHVDHLAKNMRAFGYDARFPIAFDQEGRLLDGRHRQAAAKKAEVKCATRVVTVASDLEALQYAFNANVAAGFSKHELDRIAKFIGCDASIESIGKIIGNDGKRNLIAAELIRDAGRSDNAIAKKLGVSHHTVADVRKDFVGTGQIAKCPSRIGADGRSQPAKRAKSPEDEDATSAQAKLLRIFKDADEPSLTSLQARDRASDIGHSSISTEINKLVKKGILRKAERVKHDGRSLIAYELNPERNTVVDDKPAENRTTARVNKILAQVADLSSDERAILCRAICQH